MSKFGKVILNQHRKKAVELELIYNYPNVFAEGADYFMSMFSILISEEIDSVIARVYSELSIYHCPLANHAASPKMNKSYVNIDDKRVNPQERTPL